MQAQIKLVDPQEKLKKFESQINAKSLQKLLNADYKFKDPLATVIRSDTKKTEGFENI